MRTERGQLLRDMRERIIGRTRGRTMRVQMRGSPPGQEQREIRWWRTKQREKERERALRSEKPTSSERRMKKEGREGREAAAGAIPRKLESRNRPPLEVRQGARERSRWWAPSSVLAARRWSAGMNFNLRQRQVIIAARRPPGREGEHSAQRRSSSRCT